jgi:hypothetical protein
MTTLSAVMIRQRTLRVLTENALGLQHGTRPWHHGRSVFNLRRPRERTQDRTVEVAASEVAFMRERRPASSRIANRSTRAIRRIDSTTSSPPQSLKGRPSPRWRTGRGFREAAYNGSSRGCITARAVQHRHARDQAFRVHTLKSSRATTSRSDTRASGPAGQALRPAPTVPLGIRVRILQCL